MSLNDVMLSPECREYGSMPFSHVKNEYQPEELTKLTEAFNLVWPEIILANGADTESQIESLRQRVANFIIACASGGEGFEPEKLRATTLRAFTNRSAAWVSFAFVKII